MMKFRQLQTRVRETNDKFGLTGYEVMLVLDVCELLLIESNLTEIDDELFDLIVGCTETHGITTDEFMEDVHSIMRTVQDYSVKEIILEN